MSGVVQANASLSDCSCRSSGSEAQCSTAGRRLVVMKGRKCTWICMALASPSTDLRLPTCNIRKVLCIITQPSTSSLLAATMSCDWLFHSDSSMEMCVEPNVRTQHPVGLDLGCHSKTRLKPCREIDKDGALVAFLRPNWPAVDPTPI